MQVLYQNSWLQVSVIWRNPGQVIGPLLDSVFSPLRNDESSYDYCKDEIR